MKVALTAVLILLAAACSSASQSVTTPPIKPASALGAYTPTQLADAKTRLAHASCAERHGWKCGIVLAEGEGDYRNGAGWVGIIVRPTGRVETITNAWSDNEQHLYLDENVAEIEYPPGVMIRWDDSDHDNTVDNTQIEVVG